MAMTLQQERLAYFGASVAIGTCVLGLYLDERARTKARRRPLPKPEPQNRVSVYDLKTGQVLLWDRPFVSEEQYEDHRYYFRFRDGSERFLDLRGMNYRIVRRMV